MESKEGFIKYDHTDYNDEAMLKRAKDFYHNMDKRRSLRFFSDQKVDQQVIDHIIMTASSAPSGAHKQPWTFCAISSQAIKKEIRIAAEKEEHENYHGRMSDEWLKDLAVFDTNWKKPFLETVPWIIVVFKKAYDLEADQKKKNYYVNESVGIACGFLIAAIHQAGLVTLTHTPSPMNFLQKILDRPSNERPFLLLPVGYPAKDAVVPVLERKGKDEVIRYY